jgi:hypothetical protein
MEGVVRKSCDRLCCGDRMDVRGDESLACPAMKLGVDADRFGITHCQKNMPQTIRPASTIGPRTISQKNSHHDN